MPDAADAAQALLGVPTVASTQEAGKSALSEYFTFDLQWFGLFILAGGFPLPPFSFLGFGGLNLYAVGSMTYFGVKAGLQTLLTLANTYLLAYYPKLWWVGYLLVLNPWYVFDLVQMFSPAFAKEGFKVPFMNIPIGAKGKMTPALAALAVGAMSVGSYSLINMLPVELQASYKPLLNSVFLTVGTLVTITGGGLSSMLVLPQAYNAIKASLAEAGVKAAATPAPVAPVATGAQTGGGAPSLSEVAQKIEAGNIKLQAGGGSDPSAAIFLGTLGVAALGGISLALIRSKAVSSS
jgi:hypothetical protein